MSIGLLAQFPILMVWLLFYYYLRAGAYRGLFRRLETSAQTSIQLENPGGMGLGRYRRSAVLTSGFSCATH